MEFDFLHEKSPNDEGDGRDMRATTNDEGATPMAGYEELPEAGMPGVEGVRANDV
jgi:hypothetical protein